jgi:hypothetical protein
MKLFLMAAGLLMTGASVYGIVDYHKKAENKAFKELYKENPGQVETESTKDVLPVPVTANKEVSAGGTGPKNTENSPVKKSIKKKTVRQKKETRTFRLKEFSRGKLG